MFEGGIGVVVYVVFLINRVWICVCRLLGDIVGGGSVLLMVRDMWF